MTIQDAIDSCDRMKPNQYSIEEKIRWLSELDGIIKKEIIDTHEEGVTDPFDGYDDTMQLDTTVLPVPAPYEDLYFHYLFAKIDFNNAEYTRFNNSMAMFNSLYASFADYYNRNHMPLQNNSITL